MIAECSVHGYLVSLIFGDQGERMKMLISLWSEVKANRKMREWSQHPFQCTPQ